jgi:transposase
MSARSHKHEVVLSEEQRLALQHLLSRGTAPVRQQAPARILLKIDRHAPGPRWTDEQVAAAFEMSRYTVIRIRERFVTQGLEDALTHRAHTQTRPRALDGEQEAHLIALSCSPSPQGQARWTLRLLAGRMVELGSVEHVSHETVRQVLKKTRLLSLAEAVLVHSSPGQCGLCLAHGRCAGGLHPSLRPPLSAGVHG